MDFKLVVIFLFVCGRLLAVKGFEYPWGKESDLVKKRSTYQMPEPSQSPLAKAAEAVILFHQNVISPIDGPRSHFRPTSSRYMLLSIRRYGFLRGYLMGLDRLMRENSDPWVYRTIVIDNTTYRFDPTF